MINLNLLILSLSLLLSSTFCDLIRNNKTWMCIHSDNAPPGDNADILL